MMDLDKMGSNADTKVLHSIPGVARLFYSGAIFSSFECSRGRKFIPNMKQIRKGVEGFKFILEISLHICIILKRLLKFSAKMSFFGLKSQILVKKWGVGNQIL